MPEIEVIVPMSLSEKLLLVFYALIGAVVLKAISYYLVKHHLYVTPYFVWHFWIEPDLIDELPKDSPERLRLHEIECRYLRRRDAKP